MDTILQFVSALDFWGWIAVIALGVVAIEAVVVIVKMRIKHCERMAMIQQGLDPGPCDQAYKKVMGAPGVGPVLDTLKLMRELGVWVEVTTLVMPTRNDSDEELRDIAGFIAGELGADVPWHISRFHPDYRDTELPPTPVETLRRAYDIGREAGLHYVYLGNVPGDDTESTRCPSCGGMLIGRHGYRIEESRLTPAGCCPDCGEEIAGVGMGGATLSAGARR